MNGGILTQHALNPELVPQHYINGIQWHTALSRLQLEDRGFRLSFAAYYISLSYVRPYLKMVGGGRQTDRQIFRWSKVDVTETEDLLVLFGHWGFVMFREM